MIVLNTCFIKRSNGLFHYGLDYGEALGDRLREVWVSDRQLAEVARSRLPGRAVRLLGRLAMLVEMRKVGGRGDTIFTASSHPLALGARTIAVVHDSYPFQGGKGRLKMAAFALAMRNRAVTAAYVNKSDALAFLERIGVPKSRVHYLPNALGDHARPAGEGFQLGDMLAVGLFGTDSDKKNYSSLFGAFSRLAARIPIRWLIYGHSNDYTRQLIVDFPQLDIEIVSSDGISLQQCLGALDMVVSVAENEGFARPVASALASGTPALLIDTPVFREFYDGSALFFQDVAALAEHLAALRPGDWLDRPSLLNAPDLRRAFCSGVEWLAAK